MRGDSPHKGWPGHSSSVEYGTGLVVDFHAAAVNGRAGGRSTTRTAAAQPHADRPPTKLGTQLGFKLGIMLGAKPATKLSICQARCLGTYFPYGEEDPGQGRPTFTP